MAYYVITYQIIVDSQLGPIGTQGATPIYNSNALKNRLKEVFHKKFPDAKNVVVKEVQVKEVDEATYWEAQKNFNP